MMKFIRDWLDQRVIKQSDITSEQWEKAYTGMPLLKGLTTDEKHTLRKLTILFMHHKSFEGAQGFVVTQSMALIISLQACLPILKLGLGVYKGWTSVIVYPSGFAPIHTFIDEAGVEHKGKSYLLGESWQRGPVVLAWDETEYAGIIDGHNLVIHEFAHKLDMQTGSANGFPSLHSNMNSGVWFDAFSAGFKDFQHKCSRGITTGIDCYAATSPAEYFAVLSEVFFEHPDVIVQHYADIYDLLRQYYRQDPLDRLNKSSAYTIT